MAYELKDGQGSLFKNDRKTEERHPDYKGSFKINGTEYDLAAWVKEGKKGKFFSLSVKEKQERESPPGNPSYDGSDIPF